MNSLYARKFRNGCGSPGLAALFVGVVFAFGSAAPSHAQALGWEGETGVFVTPLAYTASSETERFHPVLAYHFLSAGPVIGDFHETSLELGIGKRMEIGYTHEFHTFGNDPDLSYLWQSGFDIFNAKFMLVPENSFKTKWIPALSLGGIARVGVRNVGDYQPTGVGRPTSGGHTNGSVYLVASKAIPTKLIPILLSAGVRGTDAELWGMGGSAPDWQERAFGAVAFTFGQEHADPRLGSIAAAPPSLRVRRTEWYDSVEHSNHTNLRSALRSDVEVQTELRPRRSADRRPGLWLRSDRY